MLNSNRILKINGLIKNDEETYSNKNKLIKEYLDIKNLKLKEIVYFITSISFAFIFLTLFFYFYINNFSESEVIYNLKTNYDEVLYSFLKGTVLFFLTASFFDLVIFRTMTYNPVKINNIEHFINNFKAGVWGLFFSVLVLFNSFSELDLTFLFGIIFLVTLFLHTFLNCILLYKTKTELKYKNINDIKRYKKRYLKTSLSKNIKNKNNLENEIINNIRDYNDYIYFIGLVENEKLDNLKYLISRARNHLIKTYNTDDFNIIREKSEKRAFVLNY